MINDTPSEIETVKSEPKLSVEQKLEAAEKRVQDNRTAFLKSSHKSAKLEKLNEALTKKLKEAVTGVSTLSPEEQRRLADLKYVDPDKYIVEVTTINDKATAVVDSILAEADIVAEKAAQTQTDQEVIEEFVRNNPSISLENLKDDVPFKLRKSFEDAEINTQEFLKQAEAYFRAKKVPPKGDDVLDQVSLRDVGGSLQASKTAKENQVQKNYAQLTF